MITPLILRLGEWAEKGMDHDNIAMYMLYLFTFSAIIMAVIGIVIIALYQGLSLVGIVDLNGPCPPGTSQVKEFQYFIPGANGTQIPVYETVGCSS